MLEIVLFLLLVLLFAAGAGAGTAYAAMHGVLGFWAAKNFAVLGFIATPIGLALGLLILWLVRRFVAYWRAK